MKYNKEQKWEMAEKSGKSQWQQEFKTALTDISWLKLFTIAFLGALFAVIIFVVTFTLTQAKSAGKKAEKLGDDVNRTIIYTKDQLGEKIDRKAGETNSRIDNLDGKIDNRINSLEIKLESRINKIEQRFDDYRREIENIVKKNSIEEVEVEENPGISSRIYLTTEDFSGKKDLYDLTGHSVFKNAAHAHWSSNGEKMVFISIKGSESQGPMYIFDIGENSLFKITKAGKESLFPKFSPDGKMIVFSMRNPQFSDRWDIAVVSVDDKHFELLTGTKEEREKHEDLYKFNRNVLPRWSPDGSKIIFCGDNTNTRGVGFYLFIMDSDGKNRKTICSLGNVCDPSFSPKGDFILFRSTIDNPFEDVWVVPVIDGECASDECSDLELIKGKIPGLVKEGNYYFKKLTSIGNNPDHANGHIDPVWLNNEEILYLFTNEYRRSAKEKQDWWDVKWTVIKMNIYSGEIREFQITKASYRNPQLRNK